MWRIFTSQAQCVTLVDSSSMTLTNMADWLLVAETLTFCLCVKATVLCHIKAAGAQSNFLCTLLHE